ncbi:MAG TPA: hypothetical protein VN636_09580 [Acidimicrobiia bacterium]|nr:hypothetical protein [Acidimicrobiia bacterium]
MINQALGHHAVEERVAAIRKGNAKIALSESRQRYEKRKRHYDDDQRFDNDSADRETISRMRGLLALEGDLQSVFRQRRRRLHRILHVFGYNLA